MNDVLQPGQVGVGVTGIGSWPGQDVREALRVVRGELGAAPEGVWGLPYLPELPARGPGADMIGRTAHLLVDLPVDLQPQGWRLVDHPGRDAERAGALWRQDVDELAEAFDGWAGPLKLQVTGPWTMAAALWLPLGDRVLRDAGAVRDLADSLAEGVRQHVALVRRLLPAAQLVVQVDEPSLPAVLAGRVRTESGLSVLPTPDIGQAAAVLSRVLEAAGADESETLTAVHCCAGAVPVRMLRDAGAGAIALDVSLLDEPTWDELAEALESGTRLWAGVLPSRQLPANGETGSARSGAPRPAGGRAASPVEPLLQQWQRLGLERSRLREVSLTPTCGLAGASPEQARAITTASVDAARALSVAVDG